MSPPKEEQEGQEEELATYIRMKHLLDEHCTGLYL
jgi:hypothetical protein